MEGNMNWSAKAKEALQNDLQEQESLINNELGKLTESAPSFSFRSGAVQATNQRDEHLGLSYYAGEYSAPSGDADRLKFEGPHGMCVIQANTYYGDRVDGFGARCECGWHFNTPTLKKLRSRSEWYLGILNPKGQDEAVQIAAHNIDGILAKLAGKGVIVLTPDQFEDAGVRAYLVEAQPAFKKLHEVAYRMIFREKAGDMHFTSIAEWGNLIALRGEIIGVYGKEGVYPPDPVRDLYFSEKYGDLYLSARQGWGDEGFEIRVPNTLHELRSRLVRPLFAAFCNL